MIGSVVGMVRLALLISLFACSLEAVPSRRLTARQYQNMRARRLPARGGGGGIPLLNWVTPAMLVGAATGAYTYLTQKDDEKPAVENSSEEVVEVAHAAGLITLQPGERVLLESAEGVNPTAPVLLHENGESRVIQPRGF